MASKRPKIKESVNLSKTPRSVESPANYKDFPISWQLSGIDDESRWGYSALKNRIELLSDKAINELDTIHNDLFETLFNIRGRNFASLDKMLEKIHTSSNGNISAKELQVILRAVSENVFWSEIFTKLEHYENSTWYKIETEQYGTGKTKHHNIQVSRIIREAQKRLEAMHLDDVEELFSIRLNGKIRLWGVRKYSHIRILWIDLEHEICPSNN